MDKEHYSSRNRTKELNRLRDAPDECFDAFGKDSLSPLQINILCRVAWEGGHDLDAVGGQEGDGVLLAW